MAMTAQMILQVKEQMEKEKGTHLMSPILERSDHERLGRTDGDLLFQEEDREEMLDGEDTMKDLRTTFAGIFGDRK